MGRSRHREANEPEPLRRGTAPDRLTVEVAEYWTIEVENRGVEPAVGEASTLALGYSAQRWKDSYEEALVEAAITHGAKEWNWVFREWGVVLELGFADEADWLRFRATPGVKAALDAVPDPVNGLSVYPGRGGSSGVRVPNRPRPRPLAGGAIPEEPVPVISGRPLGGYTNLPAAGGRDDRHARPETHP
jgi:hypothetical protein